MFDFEAKNVVFYNSYTIYKSSRNQDLKSKIRLSIDLRFYKKSSNINQR